MRTYFRVFLAGLGAIALLAACTDRSSNSSAPLDRTQIADLEAAAPPSILAVAAERFAEAARYSESSRLSNLAIERMGSPPDGQIAQEIFFICIRMARITVIAPDQAGALSKCLDGADGWVAHAARSEGTPYSAALLHVRLGEVLNDLSLEAPARRALAFAATEVWPELGAPNRVAMGRDLVRATVRTGDEAAAPSLCRDTLDAAQAGNDGSNALLWTILVPNYDCISALPPARQNALRAALVDAIASLAQGAANGPQLTDLFTTAAYQARQGLETPVDASLLASANASSDCGAMTALDCLLELTLAYEENAARSETNSELAGQVFSLALYAGLPEQRVRARERFEEEFAGSLRQTGRFGNDSQGEAALEREVQRNVAAMQAQAGKPQAAAETLAALAPLSLAERWAAFPTVLSVANALIAADAGDAAVTFFERAWPWVEDRSYLAGEPAGAGGLSWLDVIDISRLYVSAGRADRARMILSIGTEAATDAGQIIAIGQVQMSEGFEADAEQNFARAEALGDEELGGLSRPEMMAIIAVSRLRPSVHAASPPPDLLWPAASVYWGSPYYTLN